MRYSVISKGLTISQLQDEVKRCGGRNLKVASASKQIFCELDVAGVAKLGVIDCIITKVGGVGVTIVPPIVTPPIPIAAAPVYSPEELIWAIGLEELRSMTEPPLYGSGMNLAIIDTGVLETHQKINGRVVYSKNYTSDPMRDGLDHGTGVCSIITTLAPLCNILNLKVLDDEGMGTEEEVALAIDDCISLQDTDPSIAPSVINLSLGAPDDNNPSNPLRVACRAAIDRDIWVLASAGNSGPAPYSITCPACEQYVLAIGSAKFEPFSLSNWSSRGPTLEGLVKPDAIMFGEDISVASSVSDTATTAKSGTSFAVPFASGMVLLYHESVAKWVAYEAPPGVLPRGAIGRWVITPQRFTEEFLPAICIKPEGAPTVRDSDYGCGLPFGPLLLQAITAPAIDISTVLSGIIPIFGIAMIIPVITSIFKGKK